VSFTDLVAECDLGLEVVARFLALLELFRERAVAFEQSEALGTLRVSWTGEISDHAAIVVKAEDYG
jgi:segregation and condensation protein A